MSITFAKSEVAIGALKDLGNAPVIGGIEAGAEKLRASADAVEAAGGKADVLKLAAGNVAAQKDQLGKVAEAIDASMQQPSQLAGIKEGMKGLVSGDVQHVAQAAAPAANAEAYAAPKSQASGRSA